jgi:hypothetical protein
VCVCVWARAPPPPPSSPFSVPVKRKGLFGRAGLHTCTAVCANPSNSIDGAVTGTASGKLLVWKGRNVVRILNAHESAVSVLRCIPAVGLVSGGTDARIRIWFADVTPGVCQPRECAAAAAVRVVLCGCVGRGLRLNVCAGVLVCGAGCWLRARPLRCVLCVVET